MKEPSEKKAIVEKLMKEGKTYKQISEETGIHPGTVGIYGGKIKKAERKKKNVENGLMLSNLRKLLLHCKVRSGFHVVRGCRRITRM